MVGGISLAGVLLYVNVIQQTFGINGVTKLFQLKTTEDLRKLCNLVVQSIHYWLNGNVIDEHAMLESVRLLFRAAGSFLVIFMLPIASYWRTIHEAELDNGKVFESRLFIHRVAFISFLEILSIFLFSKAYTGGQQVRYFTNPFFLMACTGVNCIYESIVKGKRIKRNALAILSAITIIVNASSMYMTNAAFQTNYKKISEIGEYLEGNNLTFGYSSFFNAAVNTMVTDDRVRVLNLHLNGRTIEVQGWYTCKRWYEPDYHSGRTFLMLTDTEYQNEYWYSFAMDICGGPVEVLKYGRMNILIYDYNIAEVLPPIQVYTY